MNEAGQGDDHLALLIARIRKLYLVEAGQPPYQTLARIADGVLNECREEKDWLRSLSRTTACDLVNGKCKKAPDWWLLRTFVVVCHRIAIRSDLAIAPLEVLLKEFSRLWQAAKGSEEGPAPAMNGDDLLTVPEADLSRAEVAGDILAPEPGERPRPGPPLPSHGTPESWGPLSRERLERAADGDARAAYEVAVLLACEAAGKGDGEEDGAESNRWRQSAAYWRGRAMGKIPEAAELRLEGERLTRAALALAVEYKKAGSPGSMDFFVAAAQAEAVMHGSRPVPEVGGPSRDRGKTAGNGRREDSGAAPDRFLS